MSSITNGTADSMRYFTATGTSITTAEIESRIARGNRPALARRGISAADARAAMAEARTARRKKTAQMPSRNWWRMLKRYVDNRSVASPTIFANSNSVEGNRNGLQLSGTTPAEPAIYLTSAGAG